MFRIAAVGSLVLMLGQPAYGQIWELEETEGACGIAATYESDGTTLVFLASFAGGEHTITVTNTNWSARQEAEYNVVIGLDRRVFSGTASGTTLSGSRGISIGVGEDFIAQLSAASRMTILRGEVVLTSVRLDGSADGVRRLAACSRRVAAREASTEAAAEALRRRREIIPQDPFYDPNTPVPITGISSWVTNDDYPSAAVRAGLEGTVGYRLTIDRTGAVSNCQITSSSGHPILDQATCASVTRRAHFNPIAPGQNQDAVRTLERQVRWQLPETP
jgi:TonB family protein